MPKREYTDWWLRKQGLIPKLPKQPRAPVVKIPSVRLPSFPKRRRASRRRREILIPPVKIPKAVDVIPKIKVPKPKPFMSEPRFLKPSKRKRLSIKRDPVKYKSILGMMSLQKRYPKHKRKTFIQLAHLFDYAKRKGLDWQELDLSLGYREAKAIIDAQYRGLGQTEKMIEVAEQRDYLKWLEAQQLEMINLQKGTPLGEALVEDRRRGRF